MTGVTSGLGAEWLYQLDQTESATFYILARSPDKCQRMIASRPLINRFFVIYADCDSLKSIADAAQAVVDLTDSVDLLVNNAGIWSNPAEERSKDGFEMIFAVNHLATFVLTEKLLPLLSAASSARIVNTASFMHWVAWLDQADVELKNKFNSLRAYSNSKLFTILATQQLARRLKGGNIQVNCFDPGIVNTPMLSHAWPRALLIFFPLFSKLIARSPQKGAETGVFLSTSSQCQGITGQYFRDKKVARISWKARKSGLSDWLLHESRRLTEPFV